MYALLLGCVSLVGVDCISWYRYVLLYKTDITLSGTRSACVLYGFIFKLEVEFLLPASVVSVVSLDACDWCSTATLLQVCEM